ncbi:MAG: hypothetical protein IPM61_07350 [Chlorobi bacterium]|nr:MAG: hypothetical protein UZ07_CHB004003349 [Chlorobi bacterium OLB7]MBK8911131.1 hypothetical protein [Chlorobiota bacterium]
MRRLIVLPSPAALLVGGCFSIEPVPDNGPAPFGLKPLLSTIPAAASDHVVYSLENKSSTMPTGTATR